MQSKIYTGYSMVNLCILPKLPVSQRHFAIAQPGRDIAQAAGFGIY
jgi:hypothetical protein